MRDARCCWTADGSQEMVARGNMLLDAVRSQAMVARCEIATAWEVECGSWAWLVMELGSRSMVVECGSTSANLLPSSFLVKPSFSSVLLSVSLFLVFWKKERVSWWVTRCGVSPMGTGDVEVAAVVRGSKMEVASDGSRLYGVGSWVVVAD
ncbi:hypothetical protein NE237_029426 [Protea cynaroides]|uniref:Uncharacterized protein n=1 Tax=Protea cynaroides TaxID=273540 RepID=A0A9Q0JTW7_9MAGN|nr:hypothetical protein NE237_029426 [Protea cynaroides]